MADDEGTSGRQGQMEVNPLKGRQAFLTVFGLWAIHLVIVRVVAHLAIVDFSIALYPERIQQMMQYWDLLARWDAEWYLRIALHGYDETATAFFPAFPLLTRGMASIGLPIDIAALTVAAACALVALWFFYLHVNDADSDVPPVATTLALLTFPVGFILVAPYSESLFLTACLGTVLACRREQLALACVAALVAGLTRIHGVALCAAMFVWFVRLPAERRRMVWILPSVAAFFGVSLSMGWMAAAANDPLIYWHAKTVTAQRMGIPGTGIVNSARELVTALLQADLVKIDRLTDLCAVGLLIAAAVTYVRRGAWHLAAFVMVYLTMTSISTMTWGATRFTLACFPAMSLWAQQYRRRGVFISLSLVGLAIQLYWCWRFVRFQYPVP